MCSDKPSEKSFLQNSFDKKKWEVERFFFCRFVEAAFFVSSETFGRQVLFSRGDFFSDFSGKILGPVSENFRKSSQ